MTARLLLLALAATVLAGCSGPPVVAMKNPATDEVQNCKNHGHFSALFQIGSPADCVAALKAQGWESWRY